MYIPPIPGGINAPTDDGRMPVWSAISGDELVLRTRVLLAGSNLPATPDNSIVRFRLCEDRFDTRTIWEGRWRAGIEPISSGQAGLVAIRIDPKIAQRLRRGTFAFSLVCTDRLLNHRTSTLNGTLQIEYEAGSDQHNIPYKTPDETAYR
jgi:hypothetical protein